MIGKTISHYKILEHIGGGGMGVVYKAEDTKLKRLVALKFLPPAFVTDPNLKKRFSIEAQAASALQHNNICAIHEIDDTAEGQIYIVMDYYEGETLKEKLEKGNLDIQVAINYTIQIAQGLQEAHRKGIIHRDIKPSNIIITDKEEVKILDFGLSKFNDQTDITKSSSTPGTVAYMSPEQLWGELIDLKTDIWSLGVVLFEMLTGQIPFKGKVDQAIVYSISKEKPKSLTDLNNKIPDKLEQIVSKALEKDAEKRYQSIGEMLNDLKSLQGLKHHGRRLYGKSSKKTVYWLSGLATLMLIFFIWSYMFKPSPVNYEYRKILAVIPFQNLSTDKEYEYYSNAITEDIRRQLCKISSLRVMSRESIDDYKKSNDDIAGISEDFNVGTVLEGSVIRSEGQLNLAVQLFDLRSKDLLWEENYNERIQNIFDIRNDIAEKIAMALNIELTLNEKKHVNRKQTKNLAAYEYYLKGGENLYHEDPQSAIKLYKKALISDPNYSEVYASLGHTYLYATYNYGFPIDLLDTALTVAMKSINLDPDCSEAYCVLGKIYSSRVKNNSDYISKAEFSHNKAIKHNNSEWKSFLNLGELKRSIGLFEEVLHWYERAVQLYPTNSYTHLYLGHTYFDLGDYNHAESQLKQAIDIEPNLKLAYLQLANVYLEQEEYEKAIESFKTGIKIDAFYQWLHHDLAIAYKNCGRFDEAISEFEICCKINPKERYHYLGLASVYTEQGDYEKAIKLYKMIQSKFPNCLYTALNYSFVLNIIGRVTQARISLERFLEKSNIEHSRIDTCYTQFAKFYLGKINENNLMHSINAANLKLKDLDSFRCNSYYIGMAHLLNLKNEFNTLSRDTVRAMEYLRKFVSSNRIKDDIEYSLAKSELKKLTNLD